jgi:hypothetical protein
MLTLGDFLEGETAQNRIAQPEDWPTRYTPSIITDTAPHILWPVFH